ncbi:hypothetical protein CA833_03275 [Novosphingobium sp. KA1]|nr:hypothetical protein CA833_03275 [Novosphingobium sp. KA1]
MHRTGFCFLPIGYARISAEDQYLDFQRDALARACCERAFEDKKLGARDLAGLTAALDDAHARGLMGRRQRGRSLATCCHAVELHRARGKTVREAYRLIGISKLMLYAHVAEVDEQAAEERRAA